jgi:hypothetical protein
MENKMSLPHLRNQVWKDGRETADLLNGSKKKPKLQQFRGVSDGRSYAIKGWRLYADVSGGENLKAGWRMTHTSILGEDGVIYFCQTTHRKNGPTTSILREEASYFKEDVCKKTLAGLKTLRQSVS